MRDDVIETLALVREIFFLADIEARFECDQHAEIFFSRYFHAAPDRDVVRCAVSRRITDEVRSAEQQSRAVRAAQPLAAGVTDQIEALADAVDDVGTGWRRRCRVTKTRNAELLRQRDVPVRRNVVSFLRRLQEKHHRCPVVRDVSDIVFRLHLDETTAGDGQGPVIGIAVLLLDDDFVFHAGRIRQLAHFVLVIQCHAGCGTEHQGRSGTRGNHRGLAADEFRDALADRVVKFPYFDLAGGGITHGVDDLRPHPRTAQGRIGAGSVNERFHTELGEVIASRNRRGQRRRFRAARGPTEHAERQHAGQSFENCASVGHRAYALASRISRSREVTICASPSFSIVAVR